MAETSSPVRAAGQLAADLQAIFGARLRSVVIYGAHARAHSRPVHTPVQTAALVDGIDYAALSACAERAARWQRAGLDMPLLLPVHEFTQSLDAFPLEYGDIIDHHVQVAGDDLFAGHGVAGEDLRRACEVQARGHVIHLREGFLLAGHDAAAVARLIVASAGPFAALVEAFTRVTGGPRDATPARLAGHLHRVADLPASTIERLLTIEEDGTLDAAAAVQLFPPYLDLMQALVAVVDGWRAANRTRDDATTLTSASPEAAPSPAAPHHDG
jgi:hypothetical protein